MLRAGAGNGRRYVLLLQMQKRTCPDGGLGLSVVRISTKERV